MWLRESQLRGRDRGSQGKLGGAVQALLTVRHHGYTLCLETKIVRKFKGISKVFIATMQKSS